MQLRVCSGGTVFRAVGAVFRAAGAVFRAVGTVFRAVGAVFRAAGAVFRAAGAVFRAVGAVFRAVGAVFRAVGAVFRAVGAVFRAVGAAPCAALPGSHATTDKNLQKRHSIQHRQNRRNLATRFPLKWLQLGSAPHLLRHATLAKLRAQ